MKSIQYMKAAVAALALLGAATLAAAPSQAAALSPAAKAAFAKVVASPTADELAVLKLMEQVVPGSLQALASIVKSSPDTATLAANVEAYTALNPSLLAVIENGVAAFVVDPRLATVAASANCSADAANAHSMVRIWCGLPSLDPYPAP
jgi:hypothetical protein